MGRSTVLVYSFHIHLVLRTNITHLSMGRHDEIVSKFLYKIDAKLLHNLESTFLCRSGFGLQQCVGDRSFPFELLQD